MMSYRVNRIAEELKREVTDILQTELKDPRVSKLTSVTAVELSRDLRHAKIYVSVLGSEEEQERTLAGLRSAVGFVRSELGKRLELRHVPEIAFHLDSSIAHGVKISQLLRSVMKEGAEDS